MKKPKCKCGRISTITNYKTKERLCTECAFGNNKAKEKGQDLEDAFFEFYDRREE